MRRRGDLARLLERADEWRRVAVAPNVYLAAGVVELEVGAVTPERDRRQTEVVAGEVGERLDLAPEVI